VENSNEGDRITVADCVTAYVIDWGNEVHLIDHCPHLPAYLERWLTSIFAKESFSDRQ
jgi:glutathione S-transferase